MIGHADVRDRGITVDRVAAMFLVARERLSYLEDDRPIDLYSTSENLFTAMEATLSLLEEHDISKIGLTNRKKTKRILENIKPKFHRRADGTLELKENITDDEVIVIEKLTSLIISRATYSSAELRDQTKDVLLRLGLIDKDQISMFDERSHLVDLYAITAMHGVLFDLGGGYIAEAHAGWHADDRGPKLGVSVSAEVSYKGKKVPLHFGLFVTDLLASEWSDDFEEGRPHVSFSQPIEQLDSGKLRTIE